MAKQRKTRHELEALVFEEARKARECEGMTGVTVQGIEDDRVDYNWSVSHVHNNSTAICQHIIANIEARLQKLYDFATCLAPTLLVLVRPLLVDREGSSIHPIHITLQPALPV